MEDDFELDPRLGFGPHVVDWPLCRVQLENDSRYPWLILVPRRTNVSEIFDLSDVERAQFFFELNSAAQKVADALRPKKMNVAMLGNMVPQLHGHVIARFETDEAWPNPVWGRGDAVPYEDAARLAHTERFQTILGKAP